MAKKKRLIDLEVDEVSLVDKPAIGETVYLTKRAEGTKVTTKKKGKEEDPKGVKKEGGNADPAALVAEALEKRFGKIEKSLGDVEDMLSQSLALHESITLNLNEMLSIQLGALDAVMMLMDEAQQPDDTAAPDTGATENQTMSLITELRESVKAVREEVTKAGAKMSRTRLQALRDIAAKLTELITSVEPVEATDDAEKKTGGKKKSALLSVSKAVKASLDTLTGEVGECMNAQAELKKAQTALDDRLKGLEGTAGASDAIGDDDETAADADKSKSSKEKSVFHGLIPLDNIKESIRKREAVSAKK